MMNKTVKRVSRYLGTVCGLALIGVFLAGCGLLSHKPQFTDVPGVAPQTGTPATETPATSLTANPPAAAQATAPLGDDAKLLDRIKVGDTLVITISDIPQQVQPIEERVREDGTIMLLQNQRFVAKDKMRSELETEIRQRYVPAFFKTMTVSLKPKEQTQFYYVGGEVKVPGRQVYISRIHVLEAIRSAGDFNDFARKKAVQLIRADGSKETINCLKALKDPRLNLEIYPGDQLYVPRRNPFW
jgi:protein involved in polysaccharide export with SLBB domain